MKQIKILSKTQLQVLTTERLLAYKSKIMQVPENPSWDFDGGISKSSDDWKRLYQDVKDVLATRENV